MQIPIKRDEIYFAVKTCSKYHNERLPVIQATWGQYAKHIKYFSDIEGKKKNIRRFRSMENKTLTY